MTVNIQKKNKGFREKVAWERSVKDHRGKLVPPPKEPRKWDDSGASECMVRTQKSLRSILKKQLAMENKRRAKKLKEVEAVNTALFSWICESRARDLASATSATLEFSSGYDFNDAIGLLGSYPKYISKLSQRKDTIAKFYSLEVKFDRRLKSSLAYKRDLLIVASILTSYIVVQR